MSRIAYVDCVNKMYQGAGFPPYQWSTFDSSPWAPFRRPLAQSTIALISSTGIFVEDQTPFEPWAVNDLSFREIPKDTPRSKLRLHHNYFDHRDALVDPNCVLPLERLFDFEKVGYIGRLAPSVITMGMGRMYKRVALQKQTVPKLLSLLRSQAADAVLLVAA